MVLISSRKYYAANFDIDSKARITCHSIHLQKKSLIMKFLTLASFAIVAIAYVQTMLTQYSHQQVLKIELQPQSYHPSTMNLSVDYDPNHEIDSILHEIVSQTRNQHHRKFMTDGFTIIYNLHLMKLCTLHPICICPTIRSNYYQTASEVLVFNEDLKSLFFMSALFNYMK